MSNAQLSQKDIDRSNLHAVPAATVSQFRGFNVIISVRNHQGHR